MTDCSTNLEFPFFAKRRVTANFNAGELTTDAGLLVVRQFEYERDLIGQLSRVIHDPRDPLRVVHDQTPLLRQRILQIIAGYEDCNDAGRLREDSLFKVLVGRLPSDQALASQPTLSRFENRIDRATCREIGAVQIDWFIKAHRRLPAEMTLDMDASDFTVHGQQVLAFYNGKYNEYVYFPLFVTEAASGYLLASVLRPGNEARPIVATNVLDDVVSRLRAARPDIRLNVRADSHFGTPTVMEWLEGKGIVYIFGLIPNRVLDRLAAPFVKRVEAQFRKTGEEQKRYSSFRYRAGSWDRSRRVLVKAEVTKLGTNVRFLVTNRCGDSADLFTWSNQRGGTVEHAIDELKNGFSGDRLSCHEFNANAFRLLLHTSAHNIMVLLRQRLHIPELVTAEMHTLRIKLIKVAARVRLTARRIWFELSSSWPFAPFFEAAHSALVPQPSG